MEDVLSSLENFSPTKDGKVGRNIHQKELNKNTYPKKVSRPLLSRNESSFSNLSQEDFNQRFSDAEFSFDDEIPFDPDSYDSSESKPGSRQSSYTVSGNRISSPSRQTKNHDNYYQNTAYENSNTNVKDHKFHSADFATLSVSSAGTEEYFRMDAIPGSSLQIEQTSEIPVNLPTVRKDSSYKINNSTRPGRMFKKILSAISTSPERQIGNTLTPTSSRPFSSFSIRETIKSRASERFSKSPGLLSISPQITLSNSTEQDSDRWIEIHRNLHRTNTLTNKEKEVRRNRHHPDGFRPLNPTDLLNGVTGNEQGDGGHTRLFDDDFLFDLDTNFTLVDNAITSLNSWPYITPSDFARGYISKFKTIAEQLRGMFNFCAIKIRWERADSYNDADTDNGEESIGSLSSVMQSRRGSSLEIAASFKQMCDALNIPCSIVPGYLKGAGEVWHNVGIPRPNHYWNAVIFNGLWRIVDASLASPSFPTRHIYTKCDKKTPEYFYFLSKPSNMLYTHVPYNPSDQHIVPALPNYTLFALPIAGPKTFRYDLKLVNFNTSILRLQELEITEIIVQVPTDVEIFADVLSGSFPDGMSHLISHAEDENKKIPALAQPFWLNNMRYYRVKATLLPNYKQGALFIYVGLKGTLKSLTNNTFSLAYAFSLTHEADNNPLLSFVVRHPTPHSLKQDIYIREPQCKDLVFGHTYVFSFTHNPSDGIKNRSNGKVKMALQGSSGRIFKLQKIDDSLWEGSIKCMERGIWRGLVSSDSGTGWSAYSEWNCS